MSTSIETKKRKAPEQRRGEIVAAASHVALTEGIQCLTLRRVADELGVVPGLVNHYFPVADDLVAAAFAGATAAERDSIFAAMPETAGALQKMRLLLAALLSDESDAISLLWLDGWQASRNRPALRVEVSRQMVAWQKAIAGLITAGNAAGIFAVAEPATAAIRILALIDGLSVQAAIRYHIGYDAVRDMVVASTERELGLPAGTLNTPVP
jgi:DNA-binding transcriptional regulator YbjK